MGKYTDEDIRNMKKVTCKIAGDYLGVSPMFISMGLRCERLPIGFAVCEYGRNWSYNIIAERLIAYKYGKLTDALIVESIEQKLDQVIESFESVKNDLLLLLKNK